MGGGRIVTDPSSLHLCPQSMPKARCCAIRNASKGIKGACRRPALACFTACCCEEHEASLKQLTPSQGEMFKEMLKSSRKDSTGMIVKKLNDLRELILYSQLNILRKEAAEATLEIEQQMLAAAEQDKAARKAAEKSDLRLVLNRKRAALFRSRSLGSPNGSPVQKVVRGAVVAEAVEAAEAADGTGNDDDYEDYEMELEEYAGGTDVDAAYLAVVENAVQP